MTDNDFWNSAYSDILISGEKIAGKGEDAYLNCMSENGGIFGVFDGCGGLGARQYEELFWWTGAYAASRAVAYGLYHWFRKTAPGGIGWWNQAQDGIRQAAADALDRCSSMVRVKSSLVGGMQKEFPTTAVIGLLYWLEERRRTCLDFLWAGDSRGYVLDKSGLSQVTADDAEGQNAMSEIYSDGALTNVLSASAPFVLHEKKLLLNSPAVVFGASDGCFGYLASPMEFEFILLDTMMASQNLSQWEEKLGALFAEYAGDDYTLSGVLMGFRDFNECRQYYKARHHFLKKEYILPLSSGTREDRYRLWETYRKNYEKYTTENRRP